MVSHEYPGLEAPTMPSEAVKPLVVLLGTTQKQTTVFSSPFRVKVSRGCLYLGFREPRSSNAIHNVDILPSSAEHNTALSWLVPIGSSSLLGTAVHTRRLTTSSDKKSADRFCAHRKWLRVFFWGWMEWSDITIHKHGGVPLRPRLLCTTMT